MPAQLAELVEKFERQAAELDRLQHLLSRNSGNSSIQSSKDDGPGRAPPLKERRAKPSGWAKGKQPGAPGTALRRREESELADIDRYPGAAEANQWLKSRNTGAGSHLVDLVRWAARDGCREVCVLSLFLHRCRSALPHLSCDRPADLRTR